MSDDHTIDTGDRLGGRHWAYGPGAPAGADRPGRWPARDDSDGWYSSGAEAAHQRHLDELAHTRDDDSDDAATDDGGWLMVDPAAPDGVRPLTAAELDAFRNQVWAPHRSGANGAGGLTDAEELDTAAAVERAHRAVHDAATVAPARPSGADEEVRSAELARYDPDPCRRAGDEQAVHVESPEAGGRGDAR